MTFPPSMKQGNVSPSCGRMFAPSTMGGVFVFSSPPHTWSRVVTLRVTRVGVFLFLSVLDVVLGWIRNEVNMVCMSAQTHSRPNTFEGLAGSSLLTAFSHSQRWFMFTRGVVKGPIVNGK